MSTLPIWAFGSRYFGFWIVTRQEAVGPGKKSSIAKMVIELHTDRGNH